MITDKEGSDVERVARDKKNKIREREGEGEAWWCRQAYLGEWSSYRRHKWVGEREG